MPLRELTEQLDILKLERSPLVQIITFIDMDKSIIYNNKNKKPDFDCMV